MRKSSAKSRLARSIASALEWLESRTFLSVTQPANPGFETPSVGSGTFSAYEYNPAGASWTFTAQSGANGSGISGNGGGFTYANAPAPEGTQVAFLQGNSTISQSVNFSAGTFAIGFEAGQRVAQWQSAKQNFQVLVDGNVVGTFTPTGGGGYAAYETTAFSVGAGSHTITFKGLDTAGGDNTALVDAVHIDSVVAGVPGDAGFESPNVGSGSFGSFQYNPPSTPWTFDSLSGLNGSGITGNGSGFTAQNPNAPEGAQVGFVQGTAHIGQSISLGAGSYAINFDAAQRVQWQYGNQTFEVLLDGSVIGTFTPASGNYQAYQTNSFSATGGSHTLTFLGTNPLGGDHTAFIDDVKVVGLGTNSSGPATLTVGSGKQYGTIQAAVNAASPGDTIDVYSGTYTEQVTIPLGLDNLTLESAPGQTVTIQAPSTLDSTGAIVHIDGSKNTALQGFTITGPGTTAGTLKYGVLVDTGGTATIQNNHVTDIEDATFGATDGTGYAIAVTDGSGNVLSNIVDNYQKGGILIGLTPSVTGSPTWTQVGDVENNFVTGVGGTAQLTQNGIIFSGLGATGTAKANHVTGNSYTANNSTFGNAVGILVYDAGNGVTVLNNIAYNNDTDIVVDGGTGSSPQGSNFAVVSGNTVYNATVYDGIDLTDGVTQVTVSQNYSHNNPFDGIFIDSSTSGNTINNNIFANNGDEDIYDGTYSASNLNNAPLYGTQNFYSNNTCGTSNDPSIPTS